MENYIYELIVAFKSGKYLTYSDEQLSLSINENYISDININPQLIGDLSDKPCFSIIVITNLNTPNLSTYNSFKNFGEEIISTIQENEEQMSNIIIKDTYGNVYYNLLENNIFGVEFGSTTNSSNSNILSYKMQIYRKKDE